MVPLNLGGSVTLGPNSGTEVTVLVLGAQPFKVVYKGVRVDSATPSSTDIQHVETVFQFSNPKDHLSPFSSHSFP